MLYDLIIIGGGPAGITAAIYAARKQMSFLVITKDIGGQTAWSGDVENYTGYQFITGPELTAKFEEHMRQAGATVHEPEEVLRADRLGDTFKVKTDRAEYEARVLIIASGKKPRLLNVPGERELKNRGVQYCATCDAPLFKGKAVAVIGGGNSALDAGLQLVKIARWVNLININPQLDGDAVMREKLEASPNITIFNSARTTAILGEKFVTGLEFEHKGLPQHLALQGVFIEIGSIPSSDFIDIVDKNEAGEIKVDCANRTNCPGIFAAGDVTDVVEKQIVVACGEGSKALLGAFRYLSERRWNN